MRFVSALAFATKRRERRRIQYLFIIPVGCAEKIADNRFARQCFLILKNPYVKLMPYAKNLDGFLRISILLAALLYSKRGGDQSLLLSARNYRAAHIGLVSSNRRRLCDDPASHSHKFNQRPEQSPILEFFTALWVDYLQDRTT